MKQIAIQTIDTQAAVAECGGCGVQAGRRMTLKAAACVALAGAGMHSVWAGEDGPRKGDWLVGVDDEGKKPLGAADIKVGDKPLIVYPYDPASKTLRDGSRLNRIVLVKLDPSTFDPATAQRAADSVIAYSAFCTHQGCDVNSWVAADKSLLCFCHFSKFAPHQEAAVVEGPAPRPLPALPLKSEGGKLVVAEGFTSNPGKSA